MKKGIDISYHQGKIDFKKVKNDGIEFVILRVGYRDKVDSKFFEYIDGAKNAGIQILGVYFFSYALNIDQVKDEVKLCIDTMKKVGLGKDVFVAYDFEYDTVEKAKQKKIILTKYNCNLHTKTFCEEVKRMGYIPIIYTNIDYYKNWYDQDLLNKYPIWLADYKGEPDYKCLIQQYSNVGKVSGINTNVDMNYYYGEEFKMEEKNNSENKKRSRTEVVKLAKSWIGKKESDGSFKFIIDIYNSYKPHPRGYKMTYTASWCATFWSALAIKLDYTDIIPIECSCGELIKKAQKIGIWKESDSYEALPGDAILYDWDDDGKGDNTGWPDHIGVIEKVSNGEFTVIEGNKNNSVERRIIKVNGKFIRGFITPKYDDVDESYVVRTETSEKIKWVVTAHSLNVREKATKDSRSIGIVKKGTELTEWNSTVKNGKRWIEVMIPGSNKLGWCSEGSNGEVYLKRI